MPDSFGFIVHAEKSVFAPTKCMEYLGLIINSENMIKSLSDVKKQKIKSLCTTVLNKDFQVIRKVASLLGKIYSFFCSSIWPLALLSIKKWQNPSLDMKNIKVISIRKRSYPQLGMMAYIGGLIVSLQLSMQFR